MSLINQMLQDLEQRKVEIPATIGHRHMAMLPTSKNKYGWHVSPQVILAVSVAVMAMATMKIYQKQAADKVQLTVPAAEMVLTKNKTTTHNMLPEAHAAVFRPLQESTAHALGIVAPSTVSVKVSFQPVLDKTLQFSLADGRLTTAMNSEKLTNTLPASAPSTSLPLGATKVAYAPSTVIDTAPSLLPAAPVADAVTPVVAAVPVKKSSEKTMFAKHVSPEQEALSDYNQAIALVQQGRMAEAQDKLRKALQTQPANQEIRQVLAGLLIEDKRKSEAIALLKEGLAISPDQPQATLTLARLQLDAGQATEAIDSLEKGLPYAQEYAQYHAFLAMLMQRAERHQGAISHFQSAIKLRGETPVWLIGLAVSLQAEGRAQEAYGIFARVRPMALDADSKLFVEARIKQLAALQAN